MEDFRIKPSLIRLGHTPYPNNSQIQNILYIVKWPTQWCWREQGKQGSASCVFVYLCICVFVRLCILICVFVFVYYYVDPPNDAGDRNEGKDPHLVSSPPSRWSQLWLRCRWLNVGWTWSAPSVQPAPFAHQQTLRSHPLACVTLSSTPWRSINIRCDKLSTRHLEHGVWYPAGWVPLLLIYNDTKWLFFPSSGNWPICTCTLAFTGQLHWLAETKRVHKYWLHKIITNF